MNRLLILLLFLIIGISKAQYVSVSGEWNYTIPTTNISEAGKDFSSTYTSYANQAYVDIYYRRPWRITV